MDERPSEVKLCALNIDARQLDVAKKKVHARPGNEVHFVVGDACRLPFHGQSFDVLTAVECSFHFPSRLSG